MLRYLACVNCGFWQRHFAPPACPVCSDTRNDLPEHGWRWITEAEAAARLVGRWEALAADLVAFTTAPPLGLNGTGWLILRPDGNIAMEAAPFYTAPMLAEIARLGGVRVAAASHPHGYGALWQLQQAFGCGVAIHAADLDYTKAFAVTLPYDEPFEIAPGLTLHPTGGHYAGQAAMHDAPNRRLFAGDMVKIDLDDQDRAAALSAHKAFHKNIPLTRREIARYREALAGLAWDTTFTPFEQAAVSHVEVDAFLAAQLDQPPGVRRYALG